MGWEEGVGWEERTMTVLQDGWVECLHAWALAAPGLESNRWGLGKHLRGKDSGAW